MVAPALVIPRAYGVAVSIALAISACTDDASHRELPSTSGSDADTSAPDVMVPGSIVLIREDTLLGGEAGLLAAGFLDVVFSMAGNRLVYLTNASSSWGAGGSTLDAPAVSIVGTPDDTGFVAVDQTGTWYRFVFDQRTTQPGLVAHRLAVAGEFIYGAVGAAGVARAPVDLSAAPAVVASPAGVLDLHIFDDANWLVARGEAGVAATLHGSAGEELTLGFPVRRLVPAVTTAGQSGLIGVGAGGLAWLSAAPGAVSKLGEVALDGDCQDATQVGETGHLIVACGDRLHDVDARDPSALALTGSSVLSAGKALGVLDYGDFVFVRGTTEVMQVALDL
ncbi:MAG: hypothetical protein IV100_10675 [Myxococcales bacterium]|nr:hypothetical protein [Myxococcales bacterium]